MARIAGVNIPTQKRLPIALTYIHGIGRTQAVEICDKCDVPLERRVHELTDDEVIRVREAIDGDYQVEGDLRRQVRQNIQRLIDINCYRGQRHRRTLPAHGQRTRTNARTRRGSRKTVAGRRKAIRK